MATTYEPIATQTLGSAAASITFSSIASTYTDLRLVIVPTTSSVTNLAMRFNNDTAGNYSATQLGGDGGTATSTAGVNLTRINWTYSGATSITIPNLYTADIFSYAGSTFKTVLQSSYQDRNGTGWIENIVSLWRSTTAINSILIFPTAGTLSIGTTATLYGIKAA